MKQYCSNASISTLTLATFRWKATQLIQLEGPRADISCLEVSLLGDVAEEIAYLATLPHDSFRHIKRDANSSAKEGVPRQYADIHAETHILLIFFRLCFLVCFISLVFFVSTVSSSTVYYPYHVSDFHR